MNKTVSKPVSVLSLIPAALIVSNFTSGAVMAADLIEIEAGQEALPAYVLVEENPSSDARPDSLLVLGNAELSEEATYEITAEEAEGQAYLRQVFSGAYQFGARGLGLVFRYGGLSSDGIFEAGGEFRIETTLLLHAGIGAGVYVNLTPVPVGAGKRVYLHGKAYIVANSGYFWSGVHPGYGGGLGLRVGDLDGEISSFVELSVFREHYDSDTPITRWGSRTPLIPTLTLGSRF